MRSFPKCERYRSDTKIVLEENRSKITFLNPNQDKILEIKVDGCAIKDAETLRCDYALVPPSEVEIYIELKGSDVLHAVKQIESTINLLSSNSQKAKKLCFVVSTRVPKQTTSIQQLQSQFKKKFNASFRIKNIQDLYDLTHIPPFELSQSIILIGRGQTRQQLKGCIVVSSEIRVQTLNHLGIIAGLIDEIGLVEQIDQLIGRHPKEIVSAGQVVKAMILNGLGFVSAPLYLFERFFEGKATEHLIGPGVRPEHLNDDRLGRVLDQLYMEGLTRLFVSIALKAAAQFGVATNTLHLDSSSFYVHGEYEPDAVALSVVLEKTASVDAELRQEAAPKPIRITHGYSRDKRADLKQFIIDLICTGDGDVPLYLRVADGNEADKAVFAKLMQEFRQQFCMDGLMVADSALYTAPNMKLLQGLRWISRVPLTVAEAKRLVEELDAQHFVATSVPGYRIVERQSLYAGVAQKWVIVESEARKQADIKQLLSSLDKLEQRLNQQLLQLCTQDFRCEADALLAAERFAKPLKYHCLVGVTVTQHSQHKQPGRPRKDAQPQINYRLQASLERHQEAVQNALASSGRFVLATNVTDSAQLTAELVLLEYKRQQSPERGFRFLKDPLFFTNSVFVKSPERVEAIAFVMGLCLLVYSLGQRALRSCLVEAGETLKNQLRQPTQRPTLRWVFQCFQDVHLLDVAGVKQIANLTPERLGILRFFGSTCGQYYLLC